MKYHIHIYKISKKYEIDIKEENEVKAKLKAIKFYKEKRSKLKVVEPDCNIIVLAFNKDEKDNKR